MTTKAEFNAEEWDRVLQGPAIAGLMVVSAQRGGTIRESMEMAKAYKEARQQHARSDLLGEIVSTPPTLDAREFESVEQLRTEGLQRIRDTVALLELKASSEEIDAYKGFVLTVAERAAEATKSGGVLGIGGERVSDAERAALDELAATLGVERDTAPDTAPPRRRSRSPTRRPPTRRRQSPPPTPPRTGPPAPSAPRAAASAG
jgi:hypothetical protein